MSAAIARCYLRNASSICRYMALSQQTRTFADAPPASGQMVFTFASPSQAFYQSSEKVRQVDVPTGTGVIGILANHVPTLGVLQPGVVTVTEMEGTVTKYFVSSGSFSVNEDDSVQITAEEAVHLDDLDKDLARANLTKAQSQLSSASDDASRMEAEIAISCNEAIIGA